VAVGAREVQPGTGAGLLGGDPAWLKDSGVDPAVAVLDDPLIDHIGDDQHQILTSLREASPNQIRVEQAERENEILARHAIAVSEKLAGVNNNPQAQPFAVRSSPVVSRKAANKPG
jgi:hypothetical protein